MVEPPNCTPYKTVYPGYILPDDCGGGYVLTMIYFVSFYTFGQFIILNLLTAMIIDNFTFRSDVAHPELKEVCIQDFQNKWYRIAYSDPDMLHYEGRFLKTHLIMNLMTQIGRPLGIDTWNEAERRRFRFIMQECRMRAATLKKVTPDVNGTHFTAIGFKQMLLILVSFRFGLEIYSYADQLSRKRELTEVSLVKAATMVTAAARGLKLRAEMRKQHEEYMAKGGREGEEFRERFAHVLPTEEQEKKVGIKFEATEQAASFIVASTDEAPTRFHLPPGKHEGTGEEEPIDESVSSIEHVVRFVETVSTQAFSDDQEFQAGEQEAVSKLTGIFNKVKHIVCPAL
jgi:hypothetical protein